MSEQAINTDWKTQIGHVGVLYGGLSLEREVSLNSGQAIYDALVAGGISAELIDVTESFVREINQKNIDFAFIALHGKGGEDGSVQAILEWLNIPYLGSGVCASAIAMNKVKTKQIWQSLGLPIIPQVVLSDHFDEKLLIEKIGFPMAIKPVLDGSSVGISKVSCAADIQSAYQKARQCGSPVMAEKWIEGQELTGAIIFDQAMPLIRISVDNGFYDYESKYITNNTTYQCPCGLEPSLEKSIQQMMLTAAKAIDYKDWARVDIMLDEEKNPWLLEINTIPGMTKTSLVPKACAVFGMSFEVLVLKLLRQSWEDSYV